MSRKPTGKTAAEKIRELEIENARLQEEITHLGLFKSAVEAASDAIGMATPEGKHWYQNQAFDELFGDVGPNPPATLYVDEQVGREVFQTIMAGDEWIGDVKMSGGNRELLDIHLRAYSCKDPGGQVIGLVGVHTDITRQKQAEAALKQSETRLKRAQAVAGMGSWEYDIQTRELWGNREAAAILGIVDGSSSIPLSRFENLVFRKESVHRALEKILAGRQVFDQTFPVRREKDGEEIWVHLMAESVGEEKNDTKVVGVIQDVTARVRDDEERHRIWRLLDAAISQSPSGIIIADAPDGRIRMANQAALEIRGGTGESLTGIGVREHSLRWNTYRIDGTAYPPEELPLSRAILKGEVTRHEEVIIRDEAGNDHLVSANAAPILNSQGRITAGIVIFHDITEFQRMVEALRISQERMDAIFQAAPDPMVVYDRMGHPEFINAAFQEVFGWTFDELEGRRIPFVPEDQQELTMREINRLYQTGVPARFETRRISKDGTILDILISASVIHGLDGSYSGMVVNLTDITERKKQAAQFQQAQKMEAIGTLAGGIAHDFNNILSAVMGYSELAMYKARDGKENQKEIGKVLQAARRATDLVQQILDFSRQSEKEIRAVRLALIIREALKLLRASLPTTVEIQQEVSGSMGRVNADPTQLHQIVMNLCTNAAHAMSPGGGILRLTLEELELDEAEPAKLPELVPGRYQRISVADTGHGIQAADMDRIFDPFFTTKEKGQGTGMGLAVVHGIVKSYEGAILVESEVGRGTTFHIYLPVADGDALTAAEEIRKVPLPRGNEHILVIDDEEPIVEIGRQSIESLGYRVTALTSSLEALQQFQAQPDRFDLVITDQTMPKMTGMQLARAMLKIRRDLPIVLCTGYSSQLSEKVIQEIGIRRVIMKPFLIREVAVIIRELLDHR